MTAPTAKHREEAREKCSYDPQTVPPEAPIGMFHCPECGEMVIAGLPHPDYEDDEYNMTEEQAEVILREHRLSHRAGALEEGASEREEGGEVRCR